MKKIFLFFFLLTLLILGIYVYSSTDLLDGILKKDESTEQLTGELEPIEIEIINQERIALNPYTEVTIISPSNLELKSGAQVDFFSIGELGAQKYYIARIDSIIKGESVRRLILVDGFGQEEEIEITITREGFAFPPGYSSIDGWEGTSYVLDGDDPLNIIDKMHRLLEDFAPDDVVNLNTEFGIYTFNDAMLRRDAAANLKRMWDDCGKETGDYITVVSGYRSWKEQMELYANYVRNYGEEEANKFSAKPGHSEHQTGYAVDFTSKDVEYKLTEDFAGTAAGKWLLENSYKYGYAPSYPVGSQSQTGFYEPWQYRYIGVDQATAHHDSGLTLVEWLGTLQ